MRASRAASLLLVFALAKSIVLAGHHVPFSWWAPVAYLWQDASVVLVFVALECTLVRRQGIVWVAYTGLALYAAINIPVTRALSTPLTWPMWRAADGPLADSMWHYVTWQNAALFVSVLTVGTVAPFAFRQAPVRPVVAAMLLCTALGPAAAMRVDTLGLERNPWTVLISRALPRVPARASAGDWRARGFDHTHGEDLSRFRGAAAGRNIVLVSLESTAAQYLGLYGVHPGVMPNLSELGRSAIVFDNAYAVYPESIKGLFSILCSTCVSGNGGDHS
ncbi:MAG: hypothetical protein DMG57_31515 [Acidobacteria bacterium]|nr:MAG: hypothetical protein DMG57_31515 [Acidobacteriota bacterium]